MKSKIINQLLKLIKIKSIVTFIFLAITIYVVVKKADLPEWLVPIITLCFKELFDKDKIKAEEKKEEEE